MDDSAPKMPPRGANGRFIKSDASVAASVQADDDTLVSVKVHNPLHKITHILEEIRKHQATTVSLRFTIPLIALPIVILLAFQLGRLQTTCSQQFSSQVGVIKNLNVLQPQESPGWWAFVISLAPQIPQFIPPSQLSQHSRTILVAAGENIDVLHNVSINLSSFENQQVIVTGNYSACTHTMTLDASQNIRTF